MRAVDTNVLARLIARDHPNQAASAIRYIEPGAWVSHLALAETVWVLESVYSRTHEELVAAVEMLLDHQQLTVQEPATVRAACDQFRSRRHVSFSDCLRLEIARKAGHTPLGTFDKGLARLDGAELIRRP